MSSQPSDHDFGLSKNRARQEDQGLSLEQLSAAFARMTQGHDPYRPVNEPSVSPAIDLACEADSQAKANIEVTPRSILEAMLFVGHPQNEPITAERVASLMRGVRPVEIDELVLELNQRFAAHHCPYQIVSAGAGYRLELRPEHEAVRDRVFGRGRETRLSPAALEVLSLVAYNEPQTADQIADARGKPNGYLLSQLVRRGLLRIERSKTAGKLQRHYYTTPRLLALFHLDSLADLPRGEDLEKR